MSAQHGNMKDCREVAPGPHHLSPKEKLKEINPEESIDAHQVQYSVINNIELSLTFFGSNYDLYFCDLYIIPMMQVAGCGRYGATRCLKNSPPLALRDSTWPLTARGPACTRLSSPPGQSSVWRLAATMISLSERATALTRYCGPCSVGRC